MIGARWGLLEDFFLASFIEIELTTGFRLHAIQAGSIKAISMKSTITVTCILMPSLRRRGEGMSPSRLWTSGTAFVQC